MLYPNNIKKNYRKKDNHANRGMNLEAIITDANEYYINNDIAYIYKKPTPIGVVKVNYSNGKKIEEAYFKEQSTLDFNGIYKGFYIEFDAKETKNKTSFPLSNIHKHQIEHLKRIEKHGGIGFLIVRFTSINKTFYLSFEKLNDFLLNSERKSIPLSYFMENGYLIKDRYNPRVDYLSVIDNLYFGGKKWKGKLEKINFMNSEKIMT